MQLVLIPILRVRQSVFETKNRALVLGLKTRLVSVQMIHFYLLLLSLKVFTQKEREHLDSQIFIPKKIQNALR